MPPLKVANSKVANSQVANSQVANSQATIKSMVDTNSKVEDNKRNDFVISTLIESWRYSIYQKAMP
jgi:hypothetical protein